MLSLALGPMQMQPRVFWRITLAEWRAAIAGHDARERERRRLQAWAASYQLIAAGCDADKVTPAKLLGEKEPRRRVAKVEQPAKFDDVWNQVQAAAAAREARVAEVGEDAVRAEEVAALAKAREIARKKAEREG